MGRTRGDKNLDYGTIERMMAVGCTDAQVSAALNVSLDTITNWKNENDKFLATLKRGKEAADDAVERSLWERANGWKGIETHFCVINNELIKTEYVKYYPPDPTSMIFWLKNRRRQNWTQNPEQRPETSSLTKEEMANKIMSVIKANGFH